MVRLRNVVMAVVLATGLTGCSSRHHWSSVLALRLVR